MTCRGVVAVMTGANEQMVVEVLPDAAMEPGAVFLEARPEESCATGAQRSAGAWNGSPTRSFLATSAWAGMAEARGVEGRRARGVVDIAYTV